jgi:hypothetical protein
MLHGGDVIGRQGWYRGRIKPPAAPATRRTYGGWFGLKIHRHHFERYFRDPRCSVGDWLRVRRC